MLTSPSFGQKVNTLTGKEKKAGWFYCSMERTLPAGDNATEPKCQKTGNRGKCHEGFHAADKKPDRVQTGI